MALSFSVEKVSATGIEVISLAYKPNDFNDQIPEVIQLSVKSYASASISDKQDLFVQVNLFLNQLSLEKQIKIFNIYKQLSDILNLILIPTEVHIRLCKLSIELYKTITYVDVVTFINRLLLQGTIGIPSNVHEKYTGEYTRERTYLISDYIDLIHYTFALRFMVPFWGYHMGVIVDRSENDYKEKVCFEIVDDTSLSEYPAYEKLMTFISNSVIKTKASMATLYEFGLSTSEIPKHLLAKTVVRKLCVGTLNPQVDEDSLVRLIYNYVDGTNDRIDSSFNKNIKDKPLNSDREDGEDNSSILDAYKINQDITDGDKILLEEYMKNPYVLTQNVDPSYNVEYLDLCLEKHSELISLDIISNVHIPFVQWVLWKSVPAKSLLTVSKENLIKCFICAQSLLWHWGFEELALLVTSTRVNKQDNGYLSQLDVKGKLPKQLIQDLDNLYPYYRRKSKDEPSNKRSNVAITAIDNISEEMLKYDWVPTAPQQLINSVNHVGVIKTLSFNNSVREQIANLFLHIHKPKSKEI